MNAAPRTFRSEIKRVPALVWIGLIIAVAVLSAAGGYWFARHGGGPADLTHSATQSSSGPAGSSEAGSASMGRYFLFNGNVMDVG